MNMTGDAAHVLPAAPPTHDQELFRGDEHVELDEKAHIDRVGEGLYRCDLAHARQRTER